MISYAIFLTQIVLKTPFFKKKFKHPFFSKKTRERKWKNKEVYGINDFCSLTNGTKSIFFYIYLEWTFKNILDKKK